MLIAVLYILGYLRIFIYFAYRISSNCKRYECLQKYSSSFAELIFAGMQEKIGCNDRRLIPPIPNFPNDRH
jgi:hypothetical protein